MAPITVDQIRAAVAEHRITAWHLRRCSLCYSPLSYYFDPDGSIFYDSSCGCTSYAEAPQPRTWDEIAETFNRQTPEVRQRMWAEFVASGPVA